ncbi:MAG: hypothetical protein KC978_23760, partial [Candidatus Omnitrophica bacterium]|nr:hypothetical protein [Candidatus Omnitrophota bacterium]
MFFLKKHSRELSLFLGSVLLALLAAESLLSWVGPEEIQKRRYLNHYQVFQWTEGNTHFDSELGHFNEPNLDVEFGNPEFQTRIVTNSW